MIAHQQQGVHLPPTHYAYSHGMMHSSHPSFALTSGMYGAAAYPQQQHHQAILPPPASMLPHPHLMQHAFSSQRNNAFNGYAAQAQAQQAQAQVQAQARAQQQAQQQAQMRAHAQAQAYAQVEAQYYGREYSKGASGETNRNAMGSVHNGDMPASSSNELKEERAHLDRLFSALAAAHPPNSHAQHSLSHSLGASGYSDAALGRSYASRMSSEEQHQHHQTRQQLWASTGQIQNQGYASQQLSLPPPVNSSNLHQGTGLQPAFEFGSGSRFQPSLFEGSDRDVENTLAAAASSAHSRYNAAVVEQERRNKAIAEQEQAKRDEVANAAAWADYAVQQQNHQQQANAISQMELSQVVLPGKEITLDDEPQLIPTDASAIPPPPSIEKSAHPLAALATDLVWEAFLSAASSNSAFHLSSGNSPSMPSSGSQSPMYLQHQQGRNGNHDMDGNGTSPYPGYGGVSTHLAPRTPGNITSAKKSHVRSTSKSLSPSSNGVIGRPERATSVPRGDGEAPSTGNVFGAIGGERRPRHGSALATRHDASPGSRSDSSSPTSTAPGTPASDSATTNCIVKTSSETSLGAKMNKRLSGGIPWASTHGEESDSFSNVNQGIYHAALLKNPLHYQQAQTQSQQTQAYQRFTNNLAPPTALFEQIQKLLGATLLSQQVLLLALYFVAKTPHTCPLYPPATSQSALKSTSAPFKLLLAALVVANKHLDDNSFRNSTFAQVANVTLPEVNALEFSMLSGLDFDINVSSSDWLAWLRDLQYQRTTRFPNDRASAQAVNVERMITPLVEGVLAHQEEHVRLFVHSSPSSPLAWESSSKMTRGRSTSPTDIAMIPFSTMDDEESFSSAAHASSFDMDASGPLEAEQRPQYSKAFGAAPIPSGHAFKQQSYQQQQDRRDEPMFYSSSGYMDEEAPQNQHGYHEDWDMPEDPYAARVPF